MRLSRLVVACSLALLVPFIGTSQPAASEKDELKLLGSFETLQTLGFTPDDLAFSPHGGRLMVAASADSGVGIRGVFEVTPHGRLIEAFSLPELTTGILGFSIARVTSGPKTGHFFMVEFNGLPTVNLFEFDASFAVVNTFPVTGSLSPGDAIAFNPATQTLVIPDGGSNELIEITTSGELVRVMPSVHANGITYNETTGTYFAVSGNMLEISTDGELLRTIDLTPYGVEMAVGITSAHGKLYVADEGQNPPNSRGVVFVFKSPKGD